MKQNRFKLQQKSPYELEKGMHKIYDIIHRQEDKISQLLDKYDIRAQNPLDREVASYKNQIRTIQMGGSRTSRANSKAQRQYSAILNNRNLTQRNQIKVKLPSLNGPTQNKRSGHKKSTSKKKKESFDDYHIQLKGQLRRIYGKTGRNMYGIQQPAYSKVLRNSKGSVGRKKSHSQFLKKSERKSRQYNDEALRQSEENQMPKPLMASNIKFQQLSSDEEIDITEQTPLPAYGKSFRQKMRNQCLQQMNLLYFSRNQSMKDWSQALLSLFEKHDKQIVATRKTANYLHKFDRQYFSIGILND